MARNARADFNIPHVMLRLRKAGEVTADMVALQIEAQTKANIQQNGQIDTGFMLNSTYTVSKKSNTFVKANPSGEYLSRKSGETVKRKIAPAVHLPGNADAAVAVGAIYAIFQEERKSFLYAAAQEVSSMVRGKISGTFREALHD